MSNPTKVEIDSFKLEELRCLDLMSENMKEDCKLKTVRVNLKDNANLSSTKKTLNKNELLKWKTLRNKTLSKKIKCQEKISLLNKLNKNNLLLVSKIKI